MDLAVGAERKRVLLVIDGLPRHDGLRAVLRRHAAFHWEVIEHFHHPKKEFELLFNLLKPGGKLYCKTDLFSESKNFDSWGYKNDPTHVFFYHQKSILWIQKNIGFTSVKIDGRLIVFEK